MKKLFISCPMRGRTEENIRNSMERMHKIAEATFGEELEVIQTYIPNEAPDVTHRRVWYLGESIKMLAEADYFIGIHYEGAFPGCNVERDVAQAYGIPHAFVDISLVMPDAWEIATRNFAAGPKECASV
jgi:hypothetical protein